MLKHPNISHNRCYETDKEGASSFLLIGLVTSNSPCSCIHLMFLRLNGPFDICITLVSFDNLKVSVGKSGYSSLYEQLNKCGWDEASSSTQNCEYPCSTFSTNLLAPRFKQMYGTNAESTYERGGGHRLDIPSSGFVRYPSYPVFL